MGFIKKMRGLAVCCLTGLLFFGTYSSFAQRAPESPLAFGDFVEPDFPFITTTLNAGAIGKQYPERNLAVRCLVLLLEDNTYACFDTDLLRVSVAWEGAFMSLTTMAHVSYHQAGNKKNGIPHVLGHPIITTGIYPGWMNVGDPFIDPRPAGPNPEEIGRGPIDAQAGRWNGVRMAGDDAVLEYEISGTTVVEHIKSTPGVRGITRAFEMGPGSTPHWLVLGEFIAPDRIMHESTRVDVHMGDSVAGFWLDGESEGVRLEVLENRYIVAHIPPAESQRFRIAMWREASTSDTPTVFSEPFTMPDYSKGGLTRWEGVVETKGKLSSVPDSGSSSYVVDELFLPLPNPWRRNVRVAGFDFFSDGRAAISTFDGDIWILDGIDERLEQLQWKRFASGLYEPMSLNIVDEDIYVFGREGIVRVTDTNGNGEADFYENFSNVPIQSGESREYPLSMHPNPEGGFFLSKGAALEAGPKTNPPIMSGFRAGGPHSGSILKVSEDGKAVHRFATGLREPYIGVHPEHGWVTASDQQGHYVPSTPIYFVQEGDFFGVPATAHRDDAPKSAPPLTWVPHRVDRSGTEQVWMISDQFGPLSGSLIHLSYGKPGIYQVYYDNTGGTWQGGITDIPLEFSDPLMEARVHPQDGQLYVGGFQVWDSDAFRISGLSRVRYTGGNVDFPIAFRVGAQGILLRFDRELDEASTRSISHYTVERWNYKRTGEYGSGHFKLDGEPGQEQLDVTGIFLSEDRRALLLQIRDLKAVMQMGVTYNLLTAEGEPMRHAVYFSVTHLPQLDLEQEGISVDQAMAISESMISPGVEAAAKTPSLDRGMQLYQQIGCIACHSSDGSTDGRSGPTFKGLWGSERSFVDGTSSIADEAYLKESIWEPGARVVEGLEVEMPSYLGILDQADVESIILYIQSLGSE